MQVLCKLGSRDNKPWPERVFSGKGYAKEEEQVLAGNNLANNQKLIAGKVVQKQIGVDLELPGCGDLFCDGVVGWPLMVRRCRDEAAVVMEWGRVDVGR